MCFIIQVPLVPFIPGFSILLNVFLMLKLSLLTWIRFTIWVAAGTSSLLFTSIPPQYCDLHKYKFTKKITLKYNGKGDIYSLRTDQLITEQQSH